MGRAPCCAKVGLRRGPWTAGEDTLLTKYIQRHGEGQWKSIPNKAGLLRCPKSCRLRWMNYLRPDIKRGNIIQEEVDLIVKLQALLGNRWSLIAGRLPGRTDNEIKNYWNSYLSKKLKEKGFTTKQGMAKGGCCLQIRNNNSKKNNGNYNDNSTDGNSEKRKDGLNASEVYIPKPTTFSSIIRIPPEGSRKINDNTKETALISEEENRSNNSDMLYLNIPGFVQDGDFLYDKFAINELSPIHDLHERLNEEYLLALNSAEDQVPMNSFADSLFAQYWLTALIIYLVPNC